MDQLDLIKLPVKKELEQFNSLFDDSLTSTMPLLGQVLQHIKQRIGKRMRPILVLLTAKAFGEITDVTYNSAIGLELLHTASLVHDDVVDEAGTRRGQASVNAVYDNQAAVLVGDFILATALQRISQTGIVEIAERLSELGRTLASGELLQMSNISNDEISEDLYFEVVKQKTAAMFEMCAGLGALSVGAADEKIMKARRFGQNLGIAFQIRDDIFDYYDDQSIGKPTGNDMTEGKLTLPAIYALETAGKTEHIALAMKVKHRNATQEDISSLVAFTKDNGGIEYAERRIKGFQAAAKEFIDTAVKKPEIRESLALYVDYVVGRKV